MHANWMHLFSNMYFLMIVGDNIEDKEGSLKLLWMFLLGCLAGDVLTIMAGITRPSLGASAGISCLVVYYLMMFPQNRMRLGFIIPFRFGGGVRTLSVSAIGFLGFWAITQAFGAVFQTYGMGNVGYIAHLGGALVGVLAYATRDH
jgi:membrane associated rhomboid family serine protease